MAVVRGSTKKDEFLAFILYLQGTEAQTIFAKYGFKKTEITQP
jgi:ABC-type molybdate transport system substrate-binding protein